MFHCASFAPFWLNLFVRFFFIAIANEIVFIILFSDCSLLEYRNICLYTVILSCNLLNLLVLIVLCVSVCILQDFLYTKSCHLHIEIVFTISFVIWMPFISFSCLISLARTSSTIMNTSVRVDILVLFLILEREHSLFYH